MAAVLKTAVAARPPGVQIPLPPPLLCLRTYRTPVSRHGDVLSAQRLVVASRVEGQLADEEAVLVDHADVVVGNEEGYALPFVGLADRDVSKAAEIAEGDPTFGVDAVPPDPEVDGWRS